MTLRARVATSEHLQGLTRLCPECGKTMTSTGTMFLDEDWDGRYVEFLCPDHDNFDIWAPELEPIIQKAAEGVDITALPRRGK